MTKACEKRVFQIYHGNQWRNSSEYFNSTQLANIHECFRFNPQTNGKNQASIFLTIILLQKTTNQQGLINVISAVIPQPSKQQTEWPIWACQQADVIITYFIHAALALRRTRLATASRKHIMKPWFPTFAKFDNLIPLEVWTQYHWRYVNHLSSPP